MTTAENQFTERERVCVNCQHFRRNWNFHGIFDRFFEHGDEHYLCALRGNTEDLNPITGRVRVKQNLRSCRWMRSEDCYWGQKWTPSERFARRKENLFKVIAQDRS